jgi:anti-sigma factor RsiW
MKQTFSISDELLSAYIDRQIGEAELQRVEKALAAEPAVKHRFETLQATVNLLNNTPDVVAPRAFVLSESQVLAAGGTIRGAAKRSSFWQKWLPRMMPAATAIIAVLFFFSLKMTPSTLPTLSQQQPAPAMTTEKDNAQEANVENIETEAVAMSAEEQAPMVADEVVDEATTNTAAQPKAALIERNVTAPQEEVSATAEPASKTAQTEKVLPKSAQPQAIDASAPTETTNIEAANNELLPPAAPPSPAHSSTLTWLLGVLLILFIFLTWRITLRRPRPE